MIGYKPSLFVLLGRSVWRGTPRLTVNAPALALDDGAHISVVHVFDSLRVFAEVAQHQTGTILLNHPAHLLLPYLLGNSLKNITRSIYPHPRYGHVIDNLAEERGKDLAILRATDDLTHVARRRRSVDALSARAAEGAIGEPARIALNGLERSHDAAHTEPSEIVSCIVFTILSFVGERGLQPAVCPLMEPAGLAAAWHGGENGMNALVHHGTALRFGIGVAASRVEAIDRIVRGKDDGPRCAPYCDGTLPASEVGIRSIVRRQARAIEEHGTAVALLRGEVAWPAHHIRYVGKVLVQSCQHVFRCHLVVLDQRISILAYKERPPALGFRVVGCRIDLVVLITSQRKVFRWNRELTVLLIKIVVNGRIVSRPFQEVFARLRHRIQHALFLERLCTRSRQRHQRHDCQKEEHSLFHHHFPLGFVPENCTCQGHLLSSVSVSALEESVGQAWRS